MAFNNTENKIPVKHWFALYTKPRHEFKAVEQLNAEQISFYMPTVTRIKKWSDRKKKVTEPVLRGYIFIFATEKERLTALEQNSIVRCISERGVPAKIPEWQIENLRRFLELSNDVVVLNTIPAGTKVIIKEGPFQGVVGVILEEKKEKHLVVSIKLLNRSVMTFIPDDTPLEIVTDPKL